MKIFQHKDTPLRIKLGAQTVGHMRVPTDRLELEADGIWGWVIRAGGGG